MKRIIVALALLVSACDRAENEPDPAYAQLGNFDTAAIHIITGKDTLPLTVEVASTPEQHQLGLMERTTLPETQGMIFVYETPQDTLGGFWMYRTRIPLDIAFIDPAGSIVTIHTMQPCISPNPQLCASYRPTAPYLHVLEVNAGYFGRHGVEVGDTVRLR
jgi:uncharacterized protein